VTSPGRPASRFTAAESRLQRQEMSVPQRIAPTPDRGLGQMGEGVRREGRVR
jgi:hypothetical protein